MDCVPSSTVAALLILEESLETLSPAVEERIHSSVKDYFSSSTVIIIAHRLQFVKNCDKVMAILNGKKANLSYALLHRDIFFLIPGQEIFPSPILSHLTLHMHKAQIGVRVEQTQ
uniref:Uncharacterized protein n=1 Tax=Timema genevievae TaxID=629358 RepID=A0A7R9JZJ7_TIMGE|nr:unnamed protein product [Timema genevievae]